MHLQQVYAMQLYYNTAIEDGVNEDAIAFGAEVNRILRRKGGWDQWGITFVPVYPDESGASALRKRLSRYVTVQLCSNNTIAKFGAEFEGMSVADCYHKLIRINLDRWRTGPKPPTSTMPLQDYRQYVILHEVGHILSQCSPLHHQTQCAPDGRAPVMMQQTNGVGNCAWNPWPVPGVDDTEVRQW